MSANKPSRRLLIGVLVDVAVILFGSWDIVSFLAKTVLSSLLPPSWTTPYLLLLFFFLAGCVAIVWALNGNSLQLLFWNISYLAIHVMLVLSRPSHSLYAIDVAIIPGMIIGTIAVYLGRKPSDIRITEFS